RRLTLGPHFVEYFHFAVGVHALPESGVRERPQLPSPRQSLHRLTFQHAVVAIEIRANGLLEDEEAATDEMRFPFRLLLEFSDRRTLEGQRSKPAHRLHRRERGDGAVLLVEADGGVDVAVD